MHPEGEEARFDGRQRVRWGLGTAALAPLAWWAGAAILRGDPSLTQEYRAELLVVAAPVVAGAGICLALDAARHPLVSRWLSWGALVVGIVVGIPLAWAAV